MRRRAVAPLKVPLFVFVFFWILTVLGGCAAQQSPLLTNVRRTLAVAHTPQDVDAAYTAMLASCKAALSDRFTRARHAQWAQIGFAVIGSVTGGVVIPALTVAAHANRGWIAALGGVAGATNAVNGSLDATGLSYAANLAAQHDFLASVDALFQQLATTADLDAQKTLIDRITAKCEFYDYIMSPITQGTPS